MPTIDPKVAFWFGMAIFLAGAVAQGGTSLLSDAIPAVAIPIVVKWAGIISTLGTGVMTYMAGTNMTTSGRIAVARADDSIHQVVTTAAIANGPTFANDDKVVSISKAA